MLWDHPRACGKYEKTRYMVQNAPGSPPRVREKLCLNCSIAALQRITPACAGKTLYTRHSYHNLWDHPRVCGKNRACARCYAEGLGSPPRVREKQESMQSSRVPLRITPACAGKTTGCTGCVGCGGDHPRVCGKN